SEKPASSSTPRKTAGTGSACTDQTSSSRSGANLLAPTNAASNDAETYPGTKRSARIAYGDSQTTMLRNRWRTFANPGRVAMTGFGSRRRLVRGMLRRACAILLLACQPAGGTTPATSASSGASSGASTTASAPKPAAWDQLVDAATREGVVTVYATDAVNRPALVDAFQRAYPKIRVEATFANGTQQAQRIISERRADKYLVDVIVAG